MLRFCPPVLIERMSLFVCPVEKVEQRVIKMECNIIEGSVVEKLKQYRLILFRYISISLRTTAIERSSILKV